MTPIAMQTIGSVTQNVASWNPAREAKDAEFTYIDLSSIDQEAKSIETVSTVIGSDAPSRARQIVQQGDIVVSTVRPNLNAVAWVPRDLNGATASTGFCVLRSDLNQLSDRYLYHWVRTKLFVDEMVKRSSGANYPAVSDRIIKSSEIPLPPLDEQRRIAAVLDKADVLRRQRQESLQLTEKFLQSVFLDMFGNPATNPMNWPMQELGKIGMVQTGNTPPRSNKANYAPSGIEWIKTDNIVEDRVVVTPAAEHLSELGMNSARIAPADSLLVACIAGSEKSIGRAALTDRMVAFNQQINAITPHADTSPLFLYLLIKLCRRQIQLAAGKGMKKMINKSTFESLRLIAPPYKAQLQFEQIAGRIIEHKKSVDEHLSLADGFFVSLQQRGFRGELDLRRLQLDAREGKSPAPDRTEEPAKPTEPATAYRFMHASAAIEAAIKPLDVAVSEGKSIPWSSDYLKYRIVATQPAPFGFRDIMEKAESVFAESPPYEEIKELLLELLGKGGARPLLSQRFDLEEVKEVDAEGKETATLKGRKEIVFEPLK